MSRHELRSDDQADGGGAEAADHVDDHLRALDLDARQFRRSLVAADGKDVAAKRRTLGDKQGHQHKDGHDPDRIVDAQEFARAQLRKTRVAQFGPPDDVGEGIAVVGEHGKPARDIHHTQRGDKGGDIEAGDDKACDGAYQDTNDQRDKHDQPGVRIDDHAKQRQHKPLVDQQTGDHRRQPNDGADREVDAASENDKGHADAQNGVEGHMLGHDLDVGRIKEVVHQR